MSELTHRILIGAYGWAHAAWQEDFYPHELPEDWQLAYYGNEFPVIMVPAAYWQGSGADLIEAALEESGESLQVVYEAPLALQADTPLAEALATLQGFAQKISTMGHPCVALSIPVDSMDFPLAELLPVLDLSLPLVFSFTIELDDTQVSRLYPLFQEYGVGLGWSGAKGAESLQLGTVALTIIRGTIEIRPLRCVIETMLAKTSRQQHVVLIFQDEPPAVASMRNAAVMLDLF